MENKYSEIKELTGRVITLMLGEMEAFERRIEEMDREIVMLKKRVAELEGVPVRPEDQVSAVAVKHECSVQSSAERTEQFGADVREDHPSTMETSVLGEMFVIPESIGDKVRDRFAWMNDFPGERVDDVNMAVSLNDRLMFIRELFDGDDEQYESVMDRINETSSFEDVLMDIRSAFTEWDEDSDAVYRFYMAVRRKFV